MLRTDRIRWVTSSLALLMALITASPVESEQRFVVQVMVEFDAPDMTKYWTDSNDPVLTVSRAIGLRLKSTLQEKLFPHWEFSADAAAKPIVMTFLVSQKVLSNETAIEFRLSQKWGDLIQPETILGRSEAIWKRPGDEINDPYPAKTDKAIEVLSAIFEELLDRDRAKVEKLLRQHVPIGSGGQWQENPASRELELVLPLLWDKYQILKRSKFRLICEWASIGEVDLTMEGRGRSGKFVEPDSGQTFNAIVALPTERDVSGNRVAVSPAIYAELRQLSLHELYLVEVKRANPWRLP